jgi:hypothetical protein
MVTRRAMVWALFRVGLTAYGDGPAQSEPALPSNCLSPASEATCDSPQGRPRRQAHARSEIEQGRERERGCIAEEQLAQRRRGPQEGCRQHLWPKSG